MTEDEMVGWHHWLSVHEFEQTPGDGKGQVSLVCCSSWSRKESDTTEWLNNATCAAVGHGGEVVNTQAQHLSEPWLYYGTLCMHAKSDQSCLNPCNTLACQAPLSIGFSRQEYWGGLPYPSPEDLANPGIKSMSHFVSWIERWVRFH